MFCTSFKFRIWLLVYDIRITLEAIIKIYVYRIITNLFYKYESYGL